MTAISSSKVWLITGCTSGFGRELVRAAITRGDKVIATARDVSKIDNLKALSDNVKVLALDVSNDQATLNQIAQIAHALYGRIDILVNNAGYLLEGGLEEVR